VSERVCVRASVCACVCTCVCASCTCSCVSAYVRERKRERVYGSAKVCVHIRPICGNVCVYV